MRQVLSVSIFLFIIQFFKTNGFEYVSNETPYCYQDRDDIPECEAFHNEFCNQVSLEVKARYRIIFNVQKIGV